LQIDNVATLELAGTAAETVNFASGATAGVLKIDTATNFTGNITNVAVGDIIDLVNIAPETITSVSWLNHAPTSTADAVIGGGFSVLPNSGGDAANSITIGNNSTLTVAGPLFQVVNGTDPVGITGTIDVNDGSTLDLGGTINLGATGAIVLASAGRNTDLNFTQPQNFLTGSGKVVLGNNIANRLYTSAGNSSYTLTNVSDTIIGAGQLGTVQMTFVAGHGHRRAADPKHHRGERERDGAVVGHAGACRSRCRLDPGRDDQRADRHRRQRQLDRRQCVGRADEQGHRAGRRQHAALAAGDDQQHRHDPG
jgi:hypothetical protein